MLSNEEAIERIKVIRWEHATNKCPDREALDLAIRALEERPKGKWNEWEDERWGGVWYYCSNCHYDALYKKADGTLAQVLSDFCPTCGADMRGEGESSNEDQ